jgi:hypothetical protein
MTRFKLGIAALIGVVAMSFTVITNVAKKDVPTGCYESFSSTVPPSVEKDGQPTPISPITLQGGESGIGQVTNPASACDNTAPVCCYQVNSSNQIVSVYFGEH